MNRPPSLETQILHNFVFSTMAVSSPLLHLLSYNGQFFVVRDSTTTDVALMLLTLCLIIPAVFVIIEWIVLKMFGRTIQSAIHLFFAFLFFCMFFLTVFNRHPATSGFVLVSLALLWAASAVVLYQLNPVRTFLSFLAPCLVVIPAAFLIHYPSSRVQKTESFSVTSDVPIVVLVLDELPLATLLKDPNRIDSSSFPNFASFVQEATWFRQATSVSELSEFALPAILTGDSPNPFKPADLNAYPRNLFTMLQNSYQLKTYESITRLCPHKSTIVRPRDFQERTVSLFMDLSVIYLNILLPADLRGSIPSVTADWGNFWTTKSIKKTTPGRLEIFRDFVNLIQPPLPGSHPVLYFLHITLPHYPFEYLPSGIRYGPENDLSPFSYRNQDAGSCALQYRRYTMQAMLVDRLLGELIDRLHRTGLYDQSLILVLADHGVSFLPGEYRRVITKATAFDLMHVPLVIKFPGQTAGVVTDRDAQIIDILPTIADVLKIRLPWKLDGRSLLEKVIKREKNFLNGKKKRWEVYAAQEDRFDQAIQFQRRLLEEYPDIRKEDVHWIGQNTDRLAVRGMTDYGIRLTNPAALRSVDPKTGFMPAFITGRTEGPSPPAGTRLLVAVNHMIRAVTPLVLVPTDDEPIEGMRVIVPESSFQTGNNAVDFFAVEDPADNVVSRVPIRTALGSGMGRPNSLALRFLFNAAERNPLYWKH